MDTIYTMDTDITQLDADTYGYGYYIAVGVVILIILMCRMISNRTITKKIEPAPAKPIVVIDASGDTFTIPLIR